MPQNNDSIPELDAKWGNVIKGIGGGWTAIPNLLLRKQAVLNISPLELNVLIDLIRFWWEPKQAPFPSSEKIAAEIGVSNRTIYRALFSLEEKGFIARIAAEGKATCYELRGLVKKLEDIKNAT